MIIILEYLIFLVIDAWTLNLIRNVLYYKLFYSYYSYYSFYSNYLWFKTIFAPKLISINDKYYRIIT